MDAAAMVVMEGTRLVRVKRCHANSIYPIEPRSTSFHKKHEADVTGILHGFDRLWLQGTLSSLYNPASMEAYLQLAHVLWKDFKFFTSGITARIRAASAEIARAAGRPFHYLASTNLRKEDEAKKIALQDGIDQ